MNDAEYLFHTDAREKKRNGRGYYHKARPGKKVVLPSDRLTEKELEKMSGEVKSYNLKNPMKWAEYKTMPDDLKREYLTRLRDRYNATNNAIAEMLGVSRQPIYSECHRLGVRSLSRGARVAPEWESFVKYGTPERKTESAPTEAPAEAEEPVTLELDGAAFKNCVFAAMSDNLAGGHKLDGRRKPADMVNHPPHYTAGGVECIDAIEAATASLTGMEAVCTAQIIKYVWRWKLKNGVEDLRKAGFYLDRLIKTAEGNV